MSGFLCVGFLHAGFFELALAQDIYKIDGVIIEGNQRIDSGAIQEQLKVTKGTLTRAQVSEDIKTLYQTGFFEQVQASIISDKQKTKLKISLVEKPTIHKVYITGNEVVEEEDLAAILAFDNRRFFDKAKVESLIRTAVAYYQSRGFYDASFEYSLVPVGDNQVDITFKVNEGAKYKIKKIRIKGLNEISESDLLDTIQTKRYKWWSSWIMGTGRLNQEMLDNDKAIIRQYLVDHGYIDGTVSDAQIEKSDKRLKITFTVNEGEEYKVGSVKASGDLFEDEAKTLEGIESKPGETFSASKIRGDSFKVSDKFSDVGYAFANVVPSTEVNRKTREVNLDFAITKGNPVKINRINIKGNEKTYDNVIRRSLKIDEQELYSGSKIKRSQELLQRLGYFEEVTISSEPAGADQVDLLVNVREGSTGTFSTGVGYSSSDGALFNARVSESNIFGTGRRAALNVDVGTERDNIIFSVDDPRVNDSYVSAGFDLMRAQREFSDFDRTLEGGSLTLGYPLEEVFGESFEDLSAYIKYEYLDINIDDIDADSAQLVKDSEGTSTSSALTPRITRNTINNPLNPTKGSRQDLSIELAGLGGSEEYYLFEAKNALYQPLFNTDYGAFTFSWRTTLAYGESYDDDPFPLFRRFFPGGINSVRGYKNRSLGPKDENGNEYGGSKELINNFEVIFPLVESAGLRGVVFYDAGEAFDDDVSIDIADLRLAYGFGIRWTSPLGPIRVEFGFPIDREEDEDSMVTLFSFGAPF